MDRPKNKVGGLELNPPDRHRKKRTDADNPDGCLQACKADRWAIRRHDGARGSITCPQCGEELRREPPDENGAVQIWCSSGSHTFTEGNLLPESFEEWIFVVKRACEGIRDAQTEFHERVKWVMTSDYIKIYRDKFSVRKGNS
jgi:hypothetical protein